MDNTIVFEVQGMDTLQAAIDRAPEVAMPIAEAAIDNSLRAVYADVQPYPAETIANSPQNPNGRWYERHYGPRWIRKRALSATNLNIDELTSRKRVNIFEGAGLAGGRNTSEQLQLRWRLNKAAPGANAIEGSLENIASYGWAVQGPLEVQSDVMKNIGWKSVDDALADVSETIDQILGGMLGEIAKALADAE